MKGDQYKKWLPLDSIPSRLYCEGIHDDYEGFRIIVRGEGDDSSLLRISFDVALAYRNVDEGDLVQTIQLRPELGSFSLFVVENSSWVEWFESESCGLHSRKNIVHYAIYTSNDCIDVLSEFEPFVDWLN